MYERVPASMYITDAMDPRLARLTNGLEQHHQKFPDCSSLQWAIRNRTQKPAHAVYFDGVATSMDSLGIKPAEMFGITGPLYVPFEGTTKPGLESSYIPAAAYAASHLKVQEHALVVNRNSLQLDPFLDAIYWLRRVYPVIDRRADFDSEAESLLKTVASKISEELGPNSRGWFNNCFPVLRDIAQTSVQHNINIKDGLRRLALLGLVKHAGSNLEQFLGKDLVVCRYNDRTGEMEFVDHGASKLIDLYYGSSIIRDSSLVAVPPTSLGELHGAGCSCCDSRALLQHAHDLTDSRFLVSNSIANLVPPHNDSSVSGLHHPNLVFLEQAAQSGAELFSIMGHSRCGGIKALTDAVASKDPYPSHDPIYQWLSPAASVVRNVLRFCEENGILRYGDESEKRGQIRPIAYQLAEIEVTKWSARNAAALLHDHGYPDAKVVCEFLSVDSRDAIILDPNAPIAHELNCIRGFRDFTYLGNVRAPQYTIAAPEERPIVVPPAWFTQAINMGQRARQIRQTAKHTLA